MSLSKMYPIVGEIQQSDVKVSWTIPNLFSKSKAYLEGYDSPFFRCGDEVWSLKITLRPNDRNGENAGWISLRLLKVMYSIPCKYYASYTLGIEDVHGDDYMSKSVKDHRLESGILRFVERSRLYEDRYKVEQGNGLIIFCIIKLVHEEQEITRHASAGISSQNFKNLHLGGDDSDVTLKVKNRELRAHKRILAARSPVFSCMFKHDLVENRSGPVEITDCDPDSFQDFLQYLYSGRVDKMTGNNILEMYGLADRYVVEGFKKECVMYMIKELSIDTFYDFIALAVKHNESTLLEASTVFFTKNTKKIIETAEWKVFLSKYTEVGNELYIKAWDRNCED